MTLRRFFLAPQQLAAPQICITGDLYRHMVAVLRLTEGDQVILADGRGREVVATIQEISRDSLRAELGTELPATERGGIQITLYQGLPKGDKVDLILQKATELGVDEIVLFAATRSVPRLDRDRRDNRLVRWQRIVTEAARQSGRDSIPCIAFADTLGEALQRQEHSVKLLLWEVERQQRLKALLQGEKPVSAAFVVGPEGGLTPEEADLAASRGYQPVTLGRRILRTETAGLALLAILQYEWGDIG